MISGGGHGGTQREASQSHREANAHSAGSISPFMAALADLGLMHRADVAQRQGRRETGRDRQS